MLTFKIASFSDNCAAKNSLFPSWVDEGSQAIKRPEKEKHNRLTFCIPGEQRTGIHFRLAQEALRFSWGQSSYTQTLTVSFSWILVKSHLSFSFHPNIVYWKREGADTLDCTVVDCPVCGWSTCAVSANISPFVPHRESESRVDHNSSNLRFDQSTGLPAGAPNSLRALSFIRVLLSYLKTS